MITKTLNSSSFPCKQRGASLRYRAYFQKKKSISHDYNHDEPALPLRSLTALP